MLDALRDLRVKHLENCKAKTAEAFQELYNTAKDQASGRGVFRPLLPSVGDCVVTCMFRIVVSDLPKVTITKRTKDYMYDPRWTRTARHLVACESVLVQKLLLFSLRLLLKRLCR